MFNAPQQIQACKALQELLSMCIPDYVPQKTAVEVLTENVALRYTHAEVARQVRPCGFERINDENLALHERIAALEEDEIERWRVAPLDAPTKALLAMMAGGTATLGGTQRRAQQLVAQYVACAAQGDLFAKGSDVRAATATNLIQMTLMRCGLNAWKSWKEMQTRTKRGQH